MRNALKFKKTCSSFLCLAIVLTAFINCGQTASAATIKKSGEASTIREYGIDVSSHNGKIDWAKVKKSGVKFAILRAGYTHTLNTITNSKGQKVDVPDGKVDITTDKTFEYNYENAKKNGIKVGVYLYSYAVNSNEALEDAEALAKFIKGKTFEYPIYYDMEDKCQDKLSNDQRTKIAYAFILQMRAYGYYSGVYASENWYKNKLNYETLMENGSIWFAKWPDSGKASSNYCEYGMWQYTSSGKVGGISGRVDLNASFADYSFIKKCGLNGYSSKGNSLYVKLISAAEYSGKAVKPTPQVMVGNYTLRKDTDYKIKYYNNQRAGLAVAEFVGINDFSGYYAREFFTIRRKSFNGVTLKSLGKLAYTGGYIEPDCTLTDGKNKLTKNIDYKLSYSKNKGLGTATVTVTGINYKGKKSTTFKIVERKIKNCSIVGVESLQYNKKAQKLPKLALKVGKNVISVKEYTVKYKNNTKIGKATVTITAKSKNLKGSVTKSFNILPQRASGLKVQSFKNNKVNLKWKIVSYCDGYIVYRKNSKGEYKKVAQLKGRSKTAFCDKNLKGKQYSYKVRSYKKVNRKMYQSFAASATAKR